MTDYFVDFPETDQGPVTVRASAIVRLVEGALGTTLIALADGFEFVVQKKRAQVQTHILKR